MPTTVRNRMLIVAMALGCNGCAIVTSQRTNWQGPDVNGVSYYLPKRDIIVTMTVAEDDKPGTFEVTETATYPDISERFIADFHQSWIGSDTLKVDVTPTGLLTSTTADFQSQLPTILQNLARTAGVFAGLPSAPAFKGAPEQPCACKKKGVYKEVFSLDKTNLGKPQPAFCGYAVTVTRMSAPNDPIWKGRGLDAFDRCSADAGCPGFRQRCTDGTTSGGKGCRTFAGLFYRQSQPYRVDITGAACGPSGSAIAFSPSNAPLEFVKVERGLFADANTTLEFSDGSLKSYKQTKASELSAITALPADLAKAYFESIGTMFTQQTTALNKEEGFEKALATLLLQQQKTQACTAAIAAKDAAGIEANCK